MTIPNIVLVALLPLLVLTTKSFAQCSELPTNFPLSAKTNTQRNLLHDEIDKLKNQMADIDADDKKKIFEEIELRSTLIDGLDKLERPDFVYVTLEENLSLKLVVDNDVDSGFIKSEDYIPFVVSQNIYATDNVTTENQPKAPQWRCVAIPAGTKVFGVVDNAKGRTPFRLKGKARLEVYVDKIVLDNGTEISIQFSGPYGLKPTVEQERISKERNDRVIKDCKYDTERKCISGRLTRSTYNPAILGAGVGGAVVFSDGTDKDVARLSIFKEISNATGLNELINQSNSALKSKQIFEARTVKSDGIWLPVAKPETDSKPAASPSPTPAPADSKPKPVK